MLTLTQIALPCFLELCIFYLISTTFLSHKIDINIKNILVICSYTFLATLIEKYQLFKGLSTFVVIAFLLLGLFFLLKTTFLDTIILFMLSYLGTAALQLLIMAFFTSLKRIFDILPYLGNMIILVLAYLFYKTCSQYKLYQAIRKNRKLITILGNLFVIFFLTVCYSKINPSGFFSILLLLFIISILLLILNWDVLVNQKKIQEKDAELSAYETYLPVVNELIDQVRIRQHQFDNHLQAIRSLPVTHKDYTSLSSAVANYSAYFESTMKDAVLLKLNHKLLAGFLFSKYHQAEDQKKNLNIQIQNTNIQTVVPEYELIDILGILINNSMEAVSEGDTVTLTLDTRSNQCLIKIMNKGPLITDDLRSNMFKKGYSTKKNGYNQGLGLYNLKEIIDSYHGMLIVSNESINSEMYIVFEIEV